MKRLLLVCLIVITCSFIFAQDEPEWLSATSIGSTGIDQGSSIAVDNQGNQYVTGIFIGEVHFGATTLTTSGSYDIFIAKRDPDGNWVWAKRAGGAGYDIGWNIAVDNAANVYIMGDFRYTSNFGDTSLTSNGETDIYIAKLDTDGNWLWAVGAGGSLADNGYYLAVDNAANVYATGLFREYIEFGDTPMTTIGVEDIFVCKLDSNGNWLWAKQAGGIGMDGGLSIDVDSQSNVYVCGIYSWNCTFGNITLTATGPRSDFAAKLNTDGDWLWVTGADCTSLTQAYDIAVDNDGNVYLTGVFASTIVFGETTLTANGPCDLFVVKLDEDGNWVWAKQAGGPYNHDHGYCITTDGDANVYVIGYFYLSCSFGATSLNSAGLHDIFVAKLNTDGMLLWAVSAGGPADDYGFGIDLDNDGTIYTTGYFASTAQFGNYSVTSNGADDIFVASLGIETGIDDETTHAISELSCYPNPFNSETTISYTLPAKGQVCLDIYNSKGQLVKRLLNESQPKGKHSLTWNGTDDNGHSVASGLYLCRITSAGKQESRKMLLLK
jgi:hypothetical protein